MKIHLEKTHWISRLHHCGLEKKKYGNPENIPKRNGFSVIININQIFKRNMKFDFLNF